MKITGFDDLYNKVINNHYDFGTGSWAALNSKIKMQLDQNGEYHPVVQDDNRISNEEAEVLKEVCVSTSTLNESDVSKDLYAGVPNINYDERLGYYTGLYVGHVKEGTFRKEGSSGGFGTWIFKQLLADQEIDAVLQVTQTADKNKLFEYTVSKSIADVIKASKTKYYPVEYSEVVQYVLEHPGKYAIIGLPSYIMEARLLCKQDSRLAERIKYTVGLVCGHQKSTKFAEFLAWQCGINPGNLEAINFRKKRNHGRANQYAIEVTGRVNNKRTTIIKNMDELVGRNWGEGLFKVRASDFTDDVMNETADITLGDAWLPEYASDSQGNNIVIVRHPKVQKLINDGIKNGQLQLDTVDKETIFASQSSHYRHTRVELGYRLERQRRQRIWVPKKRVSPSKNFPWIRKEIQKERESLCLQVPEMYQKAVAKGSLEYFMQEIRPMRRKYRNLYRVKNFRAKVKRHLHL